MATKTDITLRRYSRRDLDTLAKIDGECFGPNAWAADDLLSLLRIPEIFCGVVEIDKQVVAYAIYAIDKDCLWLTRIAVRPTMQRLGIGSAIVDRIKSKLGNQKRTQIGVTVPEDNVAMQLFLREQGFVATSTIRTLIKGRDAYMFLYDICPEW